MSRVEGETTLSWADAAKHAQAKSAATTGIRLLEIRGRMFSL
jgi:hypothetical protein